MPSGLVLISSGNFGSLNLREAIFFEVFSASISNRSSYDEVHMPTMGDG